MNQEDLQTAAIFLDLANVAATLSESTPSTLTGVDVMEEID
jgi:hypothetical protein